WPGRQERRLVRDRRRAGRPGAGEGGGGAAKQPGDGRGPRAQAARGRRRPEGGARRHASGGGSMTSPSLHEIAMLEAQRAIRSNRWFSLLRIAPAAWLALDSEVQALEATVRAHLRRTDAVRRVREREVGVVL